MIPETPDQTNDENRNEGNDRSIENKQMESGSDRYLFDFQYFSLITKKMLKEVY